MAQAAVSPDAIPRCVLHPTPAICSPPRAANAGIRTSVVRHPSPSSCSNTARTSGVGARKRVRMVSRAADHLSLDSPFRGDLYSKREFESGLRSADRILSSSGSALGSGAGAATHADLASGSIPNGQRTPGTIGRSGTSRAPVPAAWARVRPCEWPRPRWSARSSRRR